MQKTFVGKFHRTLVSSLITFKKRLRERRRTINRIYVLFYRWGILPFFLSPSCHYPLRGRDHTCWLLGLTIGPAVGKKLQNCLICELTTVLFCILFTPVGVGVITLLFYRSRCCHIYSYSHLIDFGMN